MQLCDGCASFQLEKGHHSPRGSRWYLWAKVILDGLAQSVCPHFIEFPGGVQDAPTEIMKFLSKFNDRDH